ncbi:MAG: ATP-dependent zinc metalloprotease FtsH [Chlamydiales bacterium]|nr:ATP-dependent zinc metalloprotease FtsH [Chlamydiales bacterium]
MRNDNKTNNDNKKSFPTGFVLLLLAAVLVVLTFQNLSDTKKTGISFSHQLEHLVNLDLIQPEGSKKIALNDNLVTFSGKFKDQLSEDAKKRYRFLYLLDKQHELVTEKTRLTNQLSTLQQDVVQSGDWFLHLSSISIPAGGYKIVGSYYNTSDRSNNISITDLSNKETLSIKEVESLYTKVANNPTDQNIQSLASDLKGLIQNFRSPSLGIGSENLKQTLRDAEQKIDGSASLSVQEKLAVFNQVILDIHSVINELNQVQNYVRLSQLRSVRSYMENIEQYQAVAQTLETNNAELDKARSQVADVVWFFNNKELSTKALERENQETYEQWFAQAQQQWNTFPDHQGATFKAPDQPRNLVLDKKFQSEEPTPNYFSYFFTLLPIFLVAMLLYFIFSKQVKGVGTSAMNFGKSPARLLVQGADRVTFKDVAGVDEAREELEEIVDFLKDPTRFTALGARIPRGVLCVGPPGTGKTLIAKAVAGEASRPFFSISGSDFVEMFVGVGASRIRDLFDQAKKHAPCIIFIDEIDAVGRHRGAGIGGGHDEREQTLNQLLVEMDGMNTNEGIILMAATNRPDVLDKALLRPGRFDRKIVLDLPDVKGRFEILKVHAKKIKLDGSVDLDIIARQTPGCSGADLANILNESALIAARKNRRAVTKEDTLEASDKVRFGKERRSMELGVEEKKSTAFHEAGHAVVGLIVKRSDPVEKVTIIPRGFSLGATHFLPKKNRVGYWRKELLDQLAVLMGGRAAEEIFLDDMSSGAQMDIAQATKLARAMVCEWGMTDKLGTVAYDERSESNQYLMQGYSEKMYSEDTAKEIDVEVKKLIDSGYQLAKKIIAENKEKVNLMTDMLMEFETLDRTDVDEIIAGTFDIEVKKKRLKDAQEAHRKVPPPPPCVSEASDKKLQNGLEAT